jgi:hypothetical protein
MLRARDRRRPPRLGGRDNVMVLVGVWLATASAYVAQPVVGLLWSGLAIAGGSVFLVQDRPGRPVAIAALVFAGIAVVWTLVQLDGAY